MLSGSYSPSWLEGYRPRDEKESADLGRLGGLMAAGADPFDRSLPLHITASALVLHPPSRRVLLRWHGRQHAWLQVGGHADGGEVDPFSVALREATEETGLFDLSPWPSGEAAAVIHVVAVDVSPKGEEPAHEHLDVRFVLTTGSPDVIRPESPMAPLRWSPLEVAIELAPENLAETMRRVSQGLFG